MLTYENEVFAFQSNASLLLSSKHSKLFSTYLVSQNGAMRKRCFSARQNAGNEHPLKLKDRVSN